MAMRLRWSSHEIMADRSLKSRTGSVLSLDGCEQKAASEMVAKTGAKGKFNNGCPSFLQMLADSYGRISPFSDHDRCLSSPGFFSRWRIRGNGLHKKTFPMFLTWHGKTVAKVVSF